MTSAFIKYERNTPRNRIMEFLVTFAVEDDYSMMDIAKHSKDNMEGIYKRRQSEIYKKCRKG